MDTPCDIVEQYNHYTPLHVVQGLQIVFSLISIVVVIFTAFRYLIRSIFERAFKELLFVLYFLIFAHSLVIVILQGLVVAVRLTSSDPCQAQISKLLCYSLRLASVVPVYAFVWIHFGITAQRIASTITEKEIWQFVVGRIIIVIAFLYPAMMLYFLFRDESFEGRVPYCTGVTAGAAQTSQWGLIFLFTLDAINLSLDIALLAYNKHKLKIDKSFNMNAKFRMSQNIYSIQEFLPSAIFHCVCYMAQVVIALGGRTFRGQVTDIEFITINAYTYLIPYYCAIGPIILLILMKKGRLIRKEKLQNTVVAMSSDETKDTYFSALHTQWGAVSKERTSSAPHLNTKTKN